jgi:hypothetical protein
MDYSETKVDIPAPKSGVERNGGGKQKGVVAIDDMMNSSSGPDGWGYRMTSQRTGSCWGTLQYQCAFTRWEGSFRRAGLFAGSGCSGNMTCLSVKEDEREAFYSAASAMCCAIAEDDDDSSCLLSRFSLFWQRARHVAFFRCRFFTKCRISQLRVHVGWLVHVLCVGRYM